MSSEEQNKWTIMWSTLCCEKGKKVKQEFWSTFKDKKYRVGKTVGEQNFWLILNSTFFGNNTSYVSVCNNSSKGWFDDYLLSLPSKWGC